MAGTNASIKGLREILRDKVIPHEVMGKHIKELSGRNDRLLGVVGGSGVESALEGRLLQVMRDGSREVLFSPKAPLSTFSAKIQAAYALRLIDNDTRRNADYIREIRNVFAHRIAPTSFQTPEVAAVCRLLRLGKYEMNLTAMRSVRHRFRLAVLATSLAIWGNEKLELPVVLTPSSLREKRSTPHPRKRPSSVTAK